MRRLLKSSFWALTGLLVLAPSALAGQYNDGRGFYGETHDLTITNVGMMLLAFFGLLVFALSMLQRALEKRKEARKAAVKAAAKALGESRFDGGW